jgi:hypothetical protein
MTAKPQFEAAAGVALLCGKAAAYALQEMGVALAIAWYTAAPTSQASAKASEFDPSRAATHFTQCETLGCAVVEGVELTVVRAGL